MTFTLAATAGLEAGITPFLAEWVVPLQPEGAMPPVFVFPSSHSERTEIAVEAKVARSVGNDRPFWGIGHDHSHLELVRRDGAAALGAEYARQLQAIQPEGPFLLYGNCLGGYLAWETARQLLHAGRDIAGILFFEVPLRADFDDVREGPLPVHSANLWRLSHYYRPPALPIHLTHLMTAGWQTARWWEPWQHVALGSYDLVTIPVEADAAFENREERIAQHVRDWIEIADRR
jgi:hypothetical protein